MRDSDVFGDKEMQILHILWQILFLFIIESGIFILFIKFVHLNATVIVSFLFSVQLMLPPVRFVAVSRGPESRGHHACV